MHGYSIELDLRGRIALVVGFGAVGRRKAAGLLAAGAGVIAVDPEGAIGSEMEGVELRVEAYRREHLRGVRLVFAAGPSDVNIRVVNDAKEAGVWVNSASDPAAGDFRVPAVWREGGLMLTVSTAGASPALASALRDRAAESLGSAAAGLAATLAELRPMVTARLQDPGARRRVLADWGNPRWLAIFEGGGAEGVREELEGRIQGEEDG